MYYYSLLYIYYYKNDLKQPQKITTNRPKNGFQRVPEASKNHNKQAQKWSPEGPWRVPGGSQGGRWSLLGARQRKSRKNPVRWPSRGLLLGTENGPHSDQKWVKKRSGFRMAFRTRFWGDLGLDFDQFWGQNGARKWDPRRQYASTAWNPRNGPTPTQNLDFWDARGSERHRK